MRLKIRGIRLPTARLPWDNGAPPQPPRNGPKTLPDDPDLSHIESIYDALDAGDPEAALALTRHAIRESPVPDPVLRYLCGRALMELDRAAEAASELALALELDPDDPEFRVYAAWALFRSCRFDEAQATLGTDARAGIRLPETHYVRALLAERRGDLASAERGFDKAARLDPTGFPRPARLLPDEFERQLAAARAELREPFRGHLDRVDVIVDDLPADALLLDSDPPLDPEQLLGLFVGVPLDEVSSFSPGGELPPRIFLFKRNLERFASGAPELAEQIRVTLYHELGHYLGMDEEELENLGYG